MSTEQQRDEIRINLLYEEINSLKERIGEIHTHYQGIIAEREKDNAELRRTIASEEHNEMLTEEECAEQVASIREHVKGNNKVAEGLESCFYCLHQRDDNAGSAAADEIIHMARMCGATAPTGMEKLWSLHKEYMEYRRDEREYNHEHYSAISEQLQAELETIFNKKP